jgi:hypothetical protein
MTHRTPLARIPLDDGSDLVVSLDERDRIEVRIWSLTGYAKMPTGNGVTLPRYALGDLIAALQSAKRRDAA